MKKWIAYTIVSAIACTTLAQSLPPAPNMNDQRLPNGQGPNGQGPNGQGSGGQGGFGGPNGGANGGSDLPPPPRDGQDQGPPRAGGQGLRPGPIEQMKNYIDLVDKYNKMASDPTSAGVAAVISAGDMLRAKGPTAAIDYFTKLLVKTENPTVQRVIRLQLIDLYKVTNQIDKALEQVEILAAAKKE